MRGDGVRTEPLSIPRERLPLTPPHKGQAVALQIHPPTRVGGPSPGNSKPQQAAGPREHEFIDLPPHRWFPDTGY